LLLLGLEKKLAILTINSLIDLYKSLTGSIISQTPPVLAFVSSCQLFKIAAMRNITLLRSPTIVA
jgi:hypothetical protein